MLTLLTLCGPALAAETDLPDDILGTLPTPPPSVASERQQVLADVEPVIELPEDKQGRRIIQTLQKKSFMKIGRYETAVGVGFVTNDPFVNRYIVDAGFTYHVTEVFGVEVAGGYSPNLGDLDQKAITKQIITNNEVTPDISKIQFYGSLAFAYSPIYGKVAVGQGRIISFDIFGVFGGGVVNTLDDLIALGAEDDPAAQATEYQFHPTINFGGGGRVAFSDTFAVRLEGRGLSYIEVLESTTLEMKNNFTLLVNGSVFFPGMK